MLALQYKLGNQLSVYPEDDGEMIPNESLVLENQWMPTQLVTL